MLPSVKRIAIWSGPRNISTAMMRSWESRGDTFVCDEPLYAHYLKETGILHPGAREIIDTCECDWRKVVSQLTRNIPGGRPIYFQKHMTKHYLPGMDLDWLAALTNCFLIRDPKAVIISYSKVMRDFSIEETGLPQQVEIFRHVFNTTGTIPVVLDAKDVLEHPAAMLEKLCSAVGVEYTPAMLHWEPGRRPTDGIWAPYWYANVEQSTGFSPYRDQDQLLPDRLRGMAEECESLYDVLFKHRITP